MPDFYLVGGYVRDSILGLKSKDMDYAVEASSYDEMKQAILDKGGSIFLENPEYFTIRGKLPVVGAADFVLCRKEGQYKDGRHPEQVVVGTLYDDLTRRDFTMNALALTEDNKLIDFFGGCKDIKDRVIRCVGVAQERFEEDYLRLVRAVRFAITKNFSLHNDIDKCLRDPILCQGLSSVSGERIREELLKCFRANTIFTLNMLTRYVHFGQAVLSTSGLWLKPTFEE